MNTQTDRRDSVALCPAQLKAAEALQGCLGKGSCFVLWSPDGLGRTTVLRELSRRIGGARLTLREFIENASDRHPLALEETLYRIILDALKANEIVIVDDMHLLHGVGRDVMPMRGPIITPSH